ncbi:hypothetical protein [Azorhizophilus paspali]|uniref:Uncharacterized protein n=1 Tax=Azorhizophilus paspali TaxID=69963 RepID=A0ABV6SQM4_AZOPA
MRGFLLLAIHSFDFGQKQGGRLDEGATGVAQFPATQIPRLGVVWLVPTKAEHLTLREKRIGRKLAEVVLAIMRQRKSLDLDLPAALGKHVAGGSVAKIRLIAERARVIFSETFDERF